MSQLRQSKLVGKTVETVEYRGDEKSPEDLVTRSISLVFTDGTYALIEADYYDGPCLTVDLSMP